MTLGVFREVWVCVKIDMEISRMVSNSSIKPSYSDSDHPIWCDGHREKKLKQLFAQKHNNKKLKNLNTLKNCESKN